LKNWVVHVVECVPTNIVFKMLMMPSIIVMWVYDFGLHMAKINAFMDVWFNFSDVDYTSINLMI
jgi:hypothetical protein